MLIANNYPKTVSKGELVQRDAGSFDGIAGLTPLLGKWKLNLAKSDCGAYKEFLAPPRSITRTFAASEEGTIRFDMLPRAVD